jgi:hypothetical protein
VKKLSGEVQNDPKGGAHLSTSPLKIRPWCKLSLVNSYINSFALT